MSKKVAAACFFSFLAGFAVARLFWHEPAHRYKTKSAVFLVGGTGPLGTLPAGTPVLSDESIESAFDMGWWGYVPVSFGSGGEAIQMLAPLKTWDKFEDPWKIRAIPSWYRTARPPEKGKSPGH